MKHIFLKSGDYTSTLSQNISGITSERTLGTVSHFVKHDWSLKLDLVEDEYRIVQYFAVPEVAENYFVFDPVELFSNSSIDEILYLASLLPTTGVMSEVDLIKSLKLLKFDKTTNKLKDVKTNELVDETHIIPLAFSTKLFDDLGIIILNSLVRFDNIQSAYDETGIHVVDDCTIVYVDDGNSIRSKMFDPRIVASSNSVYQCDNHLFASTSGYITLSVFANHENVGTLEDLDNSKLMVKSSLKTEVVGTGEFKVYTPDNPSIDYVEISVLIPPLFEELTYSHPQEELIFKFIIVSK